jgi:hypothetical protein
MEGSRWNERLSHLANWLLAQSAAEGALTTLYAAVAPEVNGCDYIGPLNWMGMRGTPGKVKSNAASYDEAVAAKLWQVSEVMTGVQYEFKAAVAR